MVVGNTYSVALFCQFLFLVRPVFFVNKTDRLEMVGWQLADFSLIAHFGDSREGQGKTGRYFYSRCEIHTFVNSFNRPYPCFNALL